MPLLAGSILHNRYRIVKLIQQGGFGAVYQAWDIVLERPCAVKENLDTSAEAQRQFEREAKILAKLSHANLPSVNDHFFIPGQGQYLVMELVEGQDLQAMLEARGRPLPEAQVLDWVGQVCDALDYLHSQHPAIIHRDIKPANIRITPAGRAMLVDFGIAKVYDPKLKTTMGARAVTPGFSPQEQYGQGITDARSDVYALGATLYTLLTGEEPPESIQRNLGVALRPLRAINLSISPTVERAVLKALEMLPERRFQRAGALKTALSPGQVPSPGVAASQPATRQRLGGKWVVVAAMITLIIAILWILSALGREDAISLTATQTFPMAITPSLPIETALGITTRAPFTPEPTPTPLVLPWVYTVESGDTCSQIVETYGVSVSSIVRLNNLDTACEELFAGQKLLIPAITAPGIATPLATATPPLPAGTVWVSAKDGAERVYVPAGVFWMGASEDDADASQDEKPQRAVYLDAFWIDRTEVTNAMYQRCVQEGGCRLPEQQSSKTRQAYFDSPAFDDYPVIFVSWQDAQDYCVWAGRRLPTEAEWEKAARGSDGRSYPWGSQAPDSGLANFNQQVGDTTPVGSYPAGASPYGALDMAGNVAEWVSDWYAAGYYAVSSVINPLGPDSGEFRVLRGGSWLSARRAIRAVFRLWNYPQTPAEGSGFRCASSG